MSETIPLGGKKISGFLSPSGFMARWTASVCAPARPRLRIFEAQPGGRQLAPVLRASTWRLSASEVAKLACEWMCWSASGVACPEPWRRAWCAESDTECRIPWFPCCAPQHALRSSGTCHPNTDVPPKQGRVIQNRDMPSTSNVMRDAICGRTCGLGAAGWRLSIRYSGGEVIDGRVPSSARAVRWLESRGNSRPRGTFHWGYARRHR